MTHVDWSADGRYLQSTDGANEMLYWDANGRRIPSATDFRDTDWASWTCPFGWPVAGIWPPNSDGTDINALDRSPQGTVLATGDDSSKVKLFRWPAPLKDSESHSYNGHSSHVTNVRFNGDGRLLRVHKQSNTTT